MSLTTSALALGTPFINAILNPFTTVLGPDVPSSTSRKGLWAAARRAILPAPFCGNELAMSGSRLSIRAVPLKVCRYQSASSFSDTVI